MRCLSDRDVNWMFPVQEKSPPVQVKEPYGNLDMDSCRLSSCNPEYTKYITDERVRPGVRQYIETDRLKKQ